MRFVPVFAMLSALLGAHAAPAAAAPADAAPAPPDFVELSAVDPTIVQEIRYHGEHNFIGRKVDGYVEPTCILTRPAAEALQRVQQQVASQGLTVKVYDCFRPQRAVDSFVDWAGDLDDETTKAEFYPNVDKSELFDLGYIAENSGHSRGSTVDLSLVPLPVPEQRPYVPGEPLTPCFAPAGERFPDNMIDFGTGYDCFDSLSNTDDPRVVGEQRANRDLLRDLMAAQGFDGISSEWWHFTLADEPYPDTYFDFPVAAGSLAP